MRLTRVSQDKGTLNGAKNVTLFCAAISGELAARGQSRDGVGLMLPLGPGRRFRKVGAQGGSDVGHSALPNMLTRSRSAATNGSYALLS